MIEATLKEILETLKRIEGHLKPVTTAVTAPVLAPIDQNQPAPAPKQPKIETTQLPPLEPEVGPVRNTSGQVVAISAQPGNRGYDPEISQKEGLVIFCDGEPVPNAHTADAEAGIVKYYYRNDQKRIKTGVKQGKVEIKGL